MARTAVPHTHYSAGVFDALPGSDLGTTPVRSQAAQFLRQAASRPQGPPATFVQGGQAGIQGEDRRGQGRIGAASQAVPIAGDSARALDRKHLPVPASAILHDFVVSKGPPEFDPPDGGHHQGRTTGRKHVRGGLFDAHSAGSQPISPGLCSPVHFPIAVRHQHTRPDDWTRNGDCSDAGVFAGPQTPVPERTGRQHAQRALLWMQKGRTGLHLPGGTRRIPP
mmetsp:Transcript_6382/g.15833  ORF Transcript_6382/g.15833 Transcript_6382/m.15833 type:complete len:223 (+) Transcript_6382:366-1034(+)